MPSDHDASSTNSLSSSASTSNTNTNTAAAAAATCISIVITGASRGFGRAIALTVASSSSSWGRKGGYSNNGDHDDNAAAGSSLTTTSTTTVRLFLVARSAEGLEETANAIRSQQEEEQGTKKDYALTVSCHAMDLGDLSTLDKNIDELLQVIEKGAGEKSSSSSEVKRHDIIFIQNAGTIGHLGPCRTSPSLQEMQANVDLNITSCLWISARLANYVRSTIRPTTGVGGCPTNYCIASLTIVQISSLVAIADFPTFGMYSAGKAARDKYHTLLAKEEDEEETPPTKVDEPRKQNEPNSRTSSRSSTRIRTLNYAPGPLETDMVTEIRDNLTQLDASIQPHYQKPQLDPMDSARKLVRLLISSFQGDADENDDGDAAFESGAHVDYYDLPEEK